MDPKSAWENVYKTTPLEEIPWRMESASWLYQLIEDGIIPVGTALDLGCGTGEKTIYLARKSFKITGVDISKTAIKHAKQFAAQAGIQAQFYIHDATDLSFLQDKVFDFILDFSALHGIAKEKQSNYVQEIAKHLKLKGLFFLRCFSKRTPNRDKDYFWGSEVPGWKIWYFSEDNIVSLFGNYFKIIKKHQEGFKTPIRDIYFDEYLMEKI